MLTDDRRHSFTMICILGLILPLTAFSQIIQFPLSFVQFNEGAEIDQAGYASLDSLAKLLKTTEIIAEVGGYTDNVGSPVAKQLLSEARAKMVCDYLVLKHNIPEFRLKPVGYGSGKPIATNITEAGRRKNNRIEISILNPVPSARFLHLKGEVMIRKKGIYDWIEASGDRSITVFDQIQTDNEGHATVDFGSFGMIQISPNSDITVRKFSAEKNGINLELQFQTGKALIKQKDGTLCLITPNLTLICQGAELTLESRPYNADFISVWRGTAMLSWAQDSFQVPAGYGVRCMYGYAPERPQPLSPAPQLDSLTANRTLYYEPKLSRNYEFSFVKPPQSRAHIVFSGDDDMIEIIQEIVTDANSCSIAAVDIPVIFIKLSTIDSLGLEGEPSIFNFSITKTGGPRLSLSRTEIIREKGNISVIIEGETDPSCKFTINNEPIKIGKDGKFALKARFKPNARQAVLAVTDRTGLSEVKTIPLTLPARIMISPYAGGTDMIGGNFKSFLTSKIGLLVGASMAYRIGPRLYLAAFMNQGRIAAREGCEGVDASHYRTKISTAGLGIRYYPIAMLYGGIEAGTVIWQSSFDEEVLGWSIDPCMGALIGVNQSLTRRMKLFVEINADYMFNKTQADLGTNVYYIVPKLYGGLAFCF